MKNFILLISALLIAAVFGGAGYFFWDVSKGARFERLDQPTTGPSNPASGSGTNRSQSPRLSK